MQSFLRFALRVHQHLARWTTKLICKFLQPLFTHGGNLSPGKRRSLYVVSTVYSLELCGWFQCFVKLKWSAVRYLNMPKRRRSLGFPLFIINVTVNENLISSLTIRNFISDWVIKTAIKHPCIGIIIFSWKFAVEFKFISTFNIKLSPRHWVSCRAKFKWLQVLAQRNDDVRLDFTLTTNVAICPSINYPRRSVCTMEVAV